VEFAVTFDYLCPFARNAHEAVVTGIREGRPWRARFLGFSLSQVHLEPGADPVWAGRRLPRGVAALAWGLAVRDADPERFPEAHLALFAARHDRGEDIGDPAVLASAVASAGVDPGRIAAMVASGVPLQRLAEDHALAADRHAVFGVPTFIAGDQAVFVRLMERGRADDVARVLDLISETGLNEFKRTRVPR
jgi:hypothetical protein